MSATMTSRLALIAILAVGPTALAAQTATPPAGGDTAAPATDGTAAPATDGTVAVVEPEVPAQPVEGQIVMQSEGTALASDLIGSSVYSTADESIGDISDLIVNLDGTVEGVVIGVGGFLGLGEKSVAIEMSQLTVMTDPETAEPRLQTDATREDLEAAPEFMTVADQEAAEQAAQPTTTDTGTVPADTTAPATTAPADPAAPADATTTTAPADPAAPADGTAPVTGN